MIAYTVPDFTAGLGLNLFFVRLQQQRPAWFHEGVRIDSMYGCFPGCALNGGRAYLRDQVSPAKIEETFAILDEYGVKPRLTFTNMLAGPDALDDPYTAAIAEAAARHGGEAIVYRDAVGEALRERYGMPLVLSTTRAIEDAAEVNRMARRYDYVVLNYNRHKDPAFLSALDRPERIEVMVNEFCVKGCPHRQDHYRHNSEDQASGAMRPFTCVAQKADFFAHEAGHPVMFTCDEVRALHEAYGIGYFKIVGRGVPFETVLEALTYYLVRPEYRADAKRLVHQAMW